MTTVPHVRRGDRRRRGRGAPGGDRGVGAREDRGDLEALPDPLAHGDRAGRCVRRARERRGGLARVARVRHGQGRRLPGRPARRAADVRGGRRRDLRARALGAAVQPDARGQDRPAAVRRPHAQPRRGAGQARVLRGRPDGSHDPADAVPAVREAQRALLQRVLRARPADGRRSVRGGRRVRARDGRDPRVPRQGRPVRHRRVRPDVQGLLERPHADRRRPGRAVPPRAAARGHGVLPVPPDGRLQDGHPALRGRPRRGRHPAEQRGRALHGAVRADREGPRTARHGEPRDLPGDQGGPGRRAPTATPSGSTSATSRAT